MGNNVNTAALVETSLLTALTTVLAIAGFYIPLMGYLLFIVAVPFIIITVRHSIRYAAIATIAAAILVSFLTFPTYGIYIALLGGAVGSIMGITIKRGKDATASIFYGAIIATGSLGIMISIATLISGVSIVEMIDSILDETLLLTESMGLSEAFTESETSLVGMMELFKMMVPSSMIMSGVVYAIANYGISAVLLRRMGIMNIRNRSFSEFTLPSNILVGTAVILILSYLSGRMNIVDSEVLFVNVLNLFTYIFLVQGLAVLFFLLDKRGSGTATKIVSVIVVFILGMIVFVAAIGWLDSAFDFRKIRLKNTGD